MELNSKISELIGAIIGDGCIRYKPEIGQYYLEIVGNKDKEKQYFDYLKNILKKEFNLNTHIKTRERGLRLKAYSKLFVEFLINELNLPYNKEKGENIIIPKQIAQNPELLRYCLRGIVDTDGSLFLSNKSHRQDYPPERRHSRVPVYHGRFFELFWNLHEKAPHHPYHKGEVEGRIGQNQTQSRVH